MYDKFAEPLSVEDNNHHSSACNRLPIYNDGRVDEHKNACKVLLRNSILLYDKDYENEVFIKYCDILYIWLYFEIKKNMLSPSIINKIFDGSIQKVSSTGQKKPCTYFSFNENLHQPEKLMKLRIFNDNIKTLTNILNNINESNNCSCLKYVYDCIKIYKDMYRDYCSGEKKTQNLKNINTCKIVDDFGTKYSSNIYDRYYAIYKLRSLSDINDMSKATSTYIADCSLDGKRQNFYYNNDNQLDSYTQSNVTKVLGSMIGISSFLAISFKVKRYFYLNI
ncbi:hypothetical protein PVNG_02149 [Plasmodium vivax North Korean]|uniref:Variable surface protein n=1 Tax=Plasmodium vivax North Korean TaxID=1035514 RepID=A0A0J9TV68_PLAVI|nr:hypothetical protein PVNG_02149 [Plasmodium vivax North Korean]